MSERPALHYEAQINDTQNRNTDKKKKNQEIRMFYKISHNLLKQFFFILCFFCYIEYSITQYSWANALGHSVSI